MNLDILKDRRVLYTAVGGVVALMAGLLIGVVLLSRHGAAPKAPCRDSSTTPIRRPAISATTPPTAVSWR